MSRTRKSAWNLATAILFNVIWVLTGFIATPWLLRWLGSERFGIYRVLLDWIGYLMLFEVGVSGAIMACLAPKVAQGDPSSVRSTLAAGLRTYIWVIISMLIAGSGLVIALPYLLPLVTVSPRELRVAAIISLFVAALTPMAIFRALAETRQKQYLFNLLMSFQAILMTILWLVTARAGWGLPGQSLAFLIAQIPAALVLLWDATRDYGSIFSATPDPSARDKLRALNKPTLIHSVTDKISLTSNNIIVAWIIGPLAVVPFYLTLRLMTLAQMQLQSLNQSTWAGLAELYSHGESKLLRERLFELTSTVGGLGIAILGPIFAYNQQLVRAWVGQNNYAGEAITLIACINIWLWAIFNSWIWPLFGTGQIGRWATYAVISTVIKLAVSFFLTFKIHLLGPLVGTLIGFLLVDCWALPRILKQAFDLSPWRLWKAAFTPLSWGLLYAGLLWFIARSYSPFGLWAIALEMAAAMFVGILLYWTLSLDKKARTRWRDRLNFVINAY